jgi:hypothetical protein
MRQGLRPARTCAKRCTRIKKRPAVFLALAIGVLAGVFAQPAIARKRPDLVITHAEARAPIFVFKGERPAITLHFEDVTENAGNATAPGSRTYYFLVPQFQGQGTVRYFLGSREVPRLRPGSTDRGGDRVHIGSDLELGSYLLKICADSRNPITGRGGVVKESNERNNCKSTGRRFFVIKRTWQGSLSGVGGVGTAARAERWHSSGAHLGFRKYLGDGAFLYVFSGVVQWTDNGINTIGCHLSGSGTEPVDENNSGPGIKLKYGDAIYAGREALDKRFYKIHQSGTNMFGEPCSPTPVDGPANRDFLEIPRRSLVFDQRELKGRSHIGGGEAAATWRWDFS